MREVCGHHSNSGARKDRRTRHDDEWDQVGPGGQDRKGGEDVGGAGDQEPERGTLVTTADISAHQLHLFLTRGFSRHRLYNIKEVILLVILIINISISISIIQCY